MPLYRRIPKRGFTNIHARSIGVVNLADLARLSGTEVTLETLREAGILKGRFERLNVLGTGDLKKAYTVRAHKVSASAAEKIAKAGGKVEMIAIPNPKGKPKKKVKKA
jgi:large subunit ribosomal protein L15